MNIIYDIVVNGNIFLHSSLFLVALDSIVRGKEDLSQYSTSWRGGRVITYCVGARQLPRYVVLIRVSPQFVFPKSVERKQGWKQLRTGGWPISRRFSLLCNPPTTPFPYFPAAARRGTSDCHQHSCFSWEGRLISGRVVMETFPVDKEYLPFAMSRPEISNHLSIQQPQPKVLWGFQSGFVAILAENPVFDVVCYVLWYPIRMVPLFRVSHTTDDCFIH